MSRPISMWLFTVEDRGLEAAIVDKYPELFADDAVLAEAWADHQASKARIHARMGELAEAERAAAQKGTP